MLKCAFEVSLVSLPEMYYNYNNNNKIAQLFILSIIHLLISYLNWVDPFNVHTPTLRKCGQQLTDQTKPDVHQFLKARTLHKTCIV